MVRHSRDCEGPTLSRETLEAAFKHITEQVEQANTTGEALATQAAEIADVRETLSELPDKLAHKIMVPFGPLATFEGELRHTNEVMTQLGSEWFAMRTTKNAIAMLDRRRARLQEHQDDTARTSKELKARRRIAGDALGHDMQAEALAEAAEAAEHQAVPGVPGATISKDEENDVWDIREPFREGAASSTPASVGYPSPSQAASASAPAPASSSSSSVTPSKNPTPQSDFLARLREMERQEEEECSDEEFEAPANPAAFDERDELGELDDIMAEAERAPAAPPVRGADAKPIVAGPSPADLYDLMRQADATTGALPSAKDCPMVPVGGDVEDTGAFSGFVKERAPAPAAPLDEEEPSTKRMSKFKMDRARRG